MGPRRGLLDLRRVGRSIEGWEAGLPCLGEDSGGAKHNLVRVRGVGSAYPWGLDE